MSDLSNYNNLYADLAQSTYLDRTVQFPYSPKTWNLQQREAHQKGESVPFDFSRNVTDTQGDVTTAGGSGLPNGGRVFLQPDLKVKAADGSSENVMEDDETGYQSYLVTDKAKLSDSSHAYLAIRGSDNYKNPHDLWTD